MRNVIFGINITINGSCDHTLVNPDEELYEYFISQMDDVDLMVFGRKTYELMVPYWPDMAKARSGTKGENKFAETFSAIDMIVFSTTLQSAEGNTQILRGNLEEEILKLKQQPGKKISVGGVNLRSQLMALGLVDEYYFVIHPLLAGEGTRLLDRISLPDTIKLKLIDTKVFKTGAIGVHYVKE